MLTQEQVEQFEHDGFLLGSKVLEDDEVKELQGEVMRVIDERERTDIPQPIRIANLSGNNDAPVWQIVNIWQASAAFEKLIRHPVIVEEIAQLLRARHLRIWHDQIQYKPAAKGGVNMWHQDSPLWGNLMPKHEQVSAWIALDDVDESNGCMSMVPMSHMWGEQQAFLNTLKNYDELPTEFNKHPVQRRLCPVKMGHVHFHHSLTWHGSHANKSGRPRRAIALHFMSDRTRFFEKGNHIVLPSVPVKEGDRLHDDKVYPMVYQVDAPSLAYA
ncbi:MAG: phytanoyl-CoA dioxygenase family protein [Phycisphaera sp.]|nr:phytanoyl-CoA dioxygenase family protein [Phycisphaera sp.]